MRTSCSSSTRRAALRSTGRSQAPPPLRRRPWPWTVPRAVTVTIPNDPRCSTAATRSTPSATTRPRRPQASSSTGSPRRSASPTPARPLRGNDHAVGLGRRRHLRRRLGDAPAVARRREGAWTTIATATGAPYTASFDTTGVADGLVRLSRGRDRRRRHAATSTVAGRLVDNTAPAPGAVAERPERRLPVRLDALLQERRRRELQACGRRDRRRLRPGLGHFPGDRRRRAGRTPPRRSPGPRPTRRACIPGAAARRLRPTSRSSLRTRPGTGDEHAALRLRHDRSRPAARCDASGLVGTGSRYSTSTTLSIALAKGTRRRLGPRVLRRRSSSASRARSPRCDGQADGDAATTPARAYAVVATDPASPVHRQRGRRDRERASATATGMSSPTTSATRPPTRARA